MILPGLSGLVGFRGSGGDAVTLVHTSASASEIANYGDDVPGRWIVILALGGNSPSPYNLSATVSGVGADVIIRHSSGDGAGSAIGSGIFVAQPSGSSGTVTVSSSASFERFHVVRVVGYDLSVAVDKFTSTGAAPPWSVDVPAGGLTIAIANNRTGALTWTGLTERYDASLSGWRSTLAWDADMPANATTAIDYTPSSDAGGNESACVASFNPS